MTQETKVLTIIGTITAAIIIGGVFLMSKSSSPSGPTPLVDSKLLIRENSHQTGSGSEKVTIVEFGDYQCPACAAGNPIVKQIIRDYEGKVNLVYRHFPLPQHKNAVISTQAVEAAGEQGKFWEMHDKIYENQKDWEESDKTLDIFAGYAKDLGLDVNKFKEDVSSNKYTERINQDRSDANVVGINVTPTFFINGERIEGVPAPSVFKQKIDSALLKE